MKKGVPPQISNLVKCDQNYSKAVVTPYAYYKRQGSLFGIQDLFDLEPPPTI